MSCPKGIAVLNNLRPELAVLLDAAPQARRPGLPKFIGEGFLSLSDSEINDVIDAVSDELLENGLQANSEPSARGILLDELIGELTSIRLDCQSK